MPLNIEIVRSKRRTLALQVRPDGRVLVRAPLRLSEQKIREFVAAHAGWIEKQRAKIESRPAAEPLTAEALRALLAEAKRVIPARVAYWAPRVGVTYAGVTVRAQRSRWGSCGATGRLNFNCLLLLAPPEALDAVVVHELCHRRVPDHSARFYAEVLRVYPEYRTWDRWLKENGVALLRRLEP